MDRLYLRWLSFAFSFFLFLFVAEFCLAPGETLFVRGMTLKLAYTRVVRVCIVTSHDGWSLHRNFNLAAERMVLEERTRHYIASL